MKSKIAAAIAATCLVLASCGGDDSSSGGDGLSGAVEDALAAEFEQDGAPVSITDDVVSCVSGKLLDNSEMNTALQAAYDEGAEGEELLAAIDQEDTFEQEASLMLLQCLSPAEIVDLLAGEMGADGSMTDDQRSCLVDEFEKLDSDQIAEGFLAMAEGTGEGEAAGAITGALVACMGSEF
jgi:hypothetical protein